MTGGDWGVLLQDVARVAPAAMDAKFYPADEWIGPRVGFGHWQTESTCGCDTLILGGFYVPKWSDKRAIDPEDLSNGEAIVVMLDAMEAAGVNPTLKRVYPYRGKPKFICYSSDGPHFTYRPQKDCRTRIEAVCRAFVSVFGP